VAEVTLFGGVEHVERTRDPRGPPPRLLFGIAAAAGAVLVLEIGLTRLFSYTIWYHFAYLTISVALLGFGAAGSVLAAWPGLLERRGFLSSMAIAVQAGIGLCLLVIDRVSLDPLSVTSDPSQFARMLVYYVAVALPFCAGGVLVVAPIQTFPRAVGRLYFWDLAGAGLACAVSVPLIWWIGTPAATASSAVILVFVAWAYAEPGLRLRRTLLSAAVAVATLALAAGSDFRPAPTKFMSAFLSDASSELAFSSWTPINRVDVVAFDPPYREGSYISWGISPYYGGDAPGFYMIGNDGDSCAVMYEWDGDIASLEFLKHHILATPYVLLEEPSVAAIGIGGGADVLNALVHGAESVVAVEINPETIRAGRQIFNDFNGDVLNHPKVEPVVAEGRSFLRSRPDRYDLIEINSVDTLSALSTGAYVLSESYLYTADAIGDYLDHLKPGGTFAMAVADTNTPELPPRHTLRLASIVRKALEDRGVLHPERHVMVIAAGRETAFSHTLVRNEPFGAEDVRRMVQFANSRGFDAWHLPDRRMPSPTSRILSWEAPTLAAFYDRHDLNLQAITDDAPFFFNFYKWRTLLRPSTYRVLSYERTLATGQIVLLVMLLQSIAFSALAILLPLRRLDLASRCTRPERVALLAYFSALGAGFILIEISFIQRFVLFLGYPTYSLTVVMFSLLVSTGVGSLLTERISPLPARQAAALPPRLLGLGLLVVAYMALLPRIFDALLGTSLAVRVAVSVGLIVPMGVLLGSFFPIGIRIAERLSPRLVPWAWAVNGCATVIGTLVAVLAGMTWGFTVVTVAALALYACGVAGLAWVSTRSGGPGRLA